MAKKNKKQMTLLDEISPEEAGDFNEEWRKEWAGMPEYRCEDLKPFKSVIIHFEKREDLDAFAKLIEQRITFKTISLWYPKATLDLVTGVRWMDKDDERTAVEEEEEQDEQME